VCDIHIICTIYAILTGYIHTFTHTHTHTHLPACTYTHTYIYAHMHTHTYIYIHIHLSYCNRKSKWSDVCRTLCVASESYGFVFSCFVVFIFCIYVCVSLYFVLFCLVWLLLPFLFTHQTYLLKCYLLTLSNVTMKIP
jgi:hypothetical protein